LNEKNTAAAAAAADPGKKNKSMVKRTKKFQNEKILLSTERYQECQAEHYMLMK